MSANTTDTTAAFNGQFMVIPSMNCPAACSYCFGPHVGPVMDYDILDKTVCYIKELSYSKNKNNKPVKIMFHGGEPLSAGIEWWDHALGLIDNALTSYALTLQSNLWLINDEFCRLLKKYYIEVSSSLDGPLSINDFQRGIGYFEKTMAGIRLLKEHDVNVSVVSTITPANADRWREVLDFFIENKIDINIHPAVPGIQGKTIKWVLTPADYSVLLVDSILPFYLQNSKNIAISPLTEMGKGLLSDNPGVCTFKDCLGLFLAIDPSGDIYPCQRFCGNKEFSMGNVASNPSFSHLMQSRAAKKMAQRQSIVENECSSCVHYSYCRGGCYYNALSKGENEAIDPYCVAYKAVFDELQSLMLKEHFEHEIMKNSEQNASGALYCRRPVLDIFRKKNHPKSISMSAKRVIACVELAREPNIDLLSEKLVKMGISKTVETARASLENLLFIIQNDNRGLNNLYAHITFNCQLKCAHCYAVSEKRSSYKKEVSVSDLHRMILDAAELSFKKIIITGGEPLIHKSISSILNEFKTIKKIIKPVLLVLRTNFTMNLEKKDYIAIATAFDQIVVSVDGHEAFHDARRGSGSYRKTVRNIRSYLELTADMENSAELSIAGTMSDKEAIGEPGQHLHSLAGNLGIRRVRIKPVLPIGKAEKSKPPILSPLLYQSPQDRIDNIFIPLTSCGIGQNLYVEPNGDSFPCYAYQQSHTMKGNVFKSGLKAIITSQDFLKLSESTVDSNEKCRKCDYRYLCGGLCRAWSGDDTQNILDAPPSDCTPLYNYAEELYKTALRYCGL